MVKALLAGNKTQTRRPIVPRTPPQVGPLSMEPWMIDGEQEVDDEDRPLWTGYHPDYPTVHGKWFSCDYGTVGDRLFAQETYAFTDYDRDNHTLYQATHGWAARDATRNFKWLAPKTMDRRWSRIWLEITGVRVERLHEITEADAEAEGIEVFDPENDASVANIPGTPDSESWGFSTARDAFEALWATIYKPDNPTKGWKINPFVWVIEFKQVTR
jgi:hypothetical protein